MHKVKVALFLLSVTMSLYAALVVMRITVVNFTRPLVILVVLITLVYPSLGSLGLNDWERCLLISICRESQHIDFSGMLD